MSQATAPSGPEERSLEILFSIRQAFAEKGFDGASMQDLARAAGMSVGNFYRYFPSKAAIVESMVGHDLAEIEADFSKILGSTDPMGGLRSKIVERMDTACNEDGQLWAEITAAAIRKPEIGAVSLRMEAAVMAHLATIFAHVTGRSVEEAETRYAGECRLLVLLVKAMAMGLGNVGGPSPALDDKVLRIIDSTLNDIANDTAKG